MKKIFLSIFMVMFCFVLGDNVMAAQEGSAGVQGCIYVKIEDEIDHDDSDVFYASYFDEFNPGEDKYYSQNGNLLHRFKKINTNGTSLGTVFTDVGSSVDAGIANCPDYIYWSEEDGWQSTIKESQIKKEHAASVGYENVKVYQRVDGLICEYVRSVDDTNDKIVYRYFTTAGFSTNYNSTHGAGYSSYNPSSEANFMSLQASSGGITKLKCPTLSYNKDNAAVSLNSNGEIQLNSKFSYVSTAATTAPIGSSSSPGSTGTGGSGNIKYCVLGDVTFTFDADTKTMTSITTNKECNRTNAYLPDQIYDFSRNRCIYEDFKVNMLDDNACRIEGTVKNHCDTLESFVIQKYEVATITDAKKTQIPGGASTCQYTITTMNNEGETTEVTKNDYSVYYGRDANYFQCSKNKFKIDCSETDIGTKICTVRRCNYKVVQIDTYVPVCGIFKPVENGGKVLPIVKNLYRILKIAIPVLVFALTVAEFLKVLFSGEEKTMKDAFQASYKRLILMAVLILLPFIVEFIIRIAGLSQDCLQYLI